MGRSSRTKDRSVSERRCIASGKVQPTTGMIRFVVGPESEIVPDVLGKLPGRGIWITAERAALEKAFENDEIVTGRITGELIGAEAIAGAAYPCTARALETSSVCELCLERLPDAGRPLEALQQSIIELLGKEVAFNHELIGSLVHQSAEQRVAGFLMSLSDRLQRRGMPGTKFTLSMSRSDIGNYLGLASETVSRILTRFQSQGLIRIQRKRIIIVAAGELALAAAG